MPGLRKGFTCECGEKHLFSVWVFGHWHEELIHTCERCGAKHAIEEGEVTLTKKGKTL